MPDVLERAHTPPPLLVSASVPVNVEPSDIVVAIAVNVAPTEAVEKIADDVGLYVRIGVGVEPVTVIGISPFGLLVVTLPCVATTVQWKEPAVSAFATVRRFEPVRGSPPVNRV